MPCLAVIDHIDYVVYMMWFHRKNQTANIHSTDAYSVFLSFASQYSCCNIVVYATLQEPIMAEWHLQIVCRWVQR